MGALFICRIQVSGGLMRYQLKNLSIGISMTILTTPYILHLSQLCCFLTFHFSPKTSKLFLMSIQRSIKAAKTQIKKKMCKKQTNLVKISTTTQIASHVFFTVCEFFGWVEALALSHVSIYAVKLYILRGIIEKAYAPRQILASVI